MTAATPEFSNEDDYAPRVITTPADEVAPDFGDDGWDYLDESEEFLALSAKVEEIMKAKGDPLRIVQSLNMLAAEVTEYFFEAAVDYSMGRTSSNLTIENKTV